MTDSYKVGYSVDALDDLREIYSYIANELLVPETATAQLGRIRKEVRLSLSNFRHSNKRLVKQGVFFNTELTLCQKKTILDV